MAVTSFTSSFSDLLNSSVVVGEDDGAYKLFSGGNGGDNGTRDVLAEKNGSSGIPKFKSTPPPSLPISPPSYFSMPPGLSPSELLDSPVLLSSTNLLPSPTTGAIAAHALNWKQHHQRDQQQNGFVKQEEKSFSDFTFQPLPPKTKDTITSSSGFSSNFFQSSSASMPTNPTTDQAQVQHQSVQPQQWNVQQQQEIKAENQTQNNYHQPSQQQPQQQMGTDRKKFEDGYNWRKYGQKQVKGSENPRSYYKCTFANCPMKKKIEKSLIDGQITQIVYKGKHNHHKPTNTRRSSSSASGMGGGVFVSASAPAPAPQGGGYQNPALTYLTDQDTSSFGSGQMDSVATPDMDNSSVSVADDEVDRVSSGHRSRSAGTDEFDHAVDDQPGAKRWRGEAENECMSAAPAGAGSRTVREPRVVVQTTSDIDILNDGYRWRKYGQKVVKGNPNPRSYYKCTHPGCAVRKHVERAAHDLRAVITTYEGKHNHDVPPERGSGSHRLPPPYNNDINGSMDAVRPSAINYSSSAYNPRFSTASQLQQQAQQYQLQSSLAPYALEILQNAPGNFAGFGNSNGGTYGYGNQMPLNGNYNNNVNNNMYNGNNTGTGFVNGRTPEDEPREDSLLESYLC